MVLSRYYKQKATSTNSVEFFFIITFFLVRAIILWIIEPASVKGNQKDNTSTSSATRQKYALRSSRNSTIFTLRYRSTKILNSRFTPTLLAFLAVPRSPAHLFLPKIDGYKMPKWQQKIKGSTLPEILIAIAIISFTSVMGLTIYLNIQQNTQPFKHAKANELAQIYLTKSLKEHMYLDDTYKEEEFTIKQKWERCAEYPDCSMVSISVWTKQDKKLCELKQLVHGN